MRGPHVAGAGERLHQQALGLGRLAGAAGGQELRRRRVVEAEPEQLDPGEKVRVREQRAGVEVRRRRRRGERREQGGDARGPDRIALRQPFAGDEAVVGAGVLERESLPEGKGLIGVLALIQHPRAPVPGALHVVALVGRSARRLQRRERCQRARRVGPPLPEPEGLEQRLAQLVPLGVPLGDAVQPRERANRVTVLGEEDPRRRTARRRRAGSRGTPSRARRRSSPPTPEPPPPATCRAGTSRAPGGPGRCSRAPPAGARPAPRSGAAPCAALAPRPAAPGRRADRESSASGARAAARPGPGGFDAARPATRRGPRWRRR